MVSADGRPLMPTTPAKARKMIRDGVAVGRFNKLGIFYVQMLIPVGDKTQDVSMTMDPGSKYDGYAVGTAKGTTLKAMAKMPEKNLGKTHPQKKNEEISQVQKNVEETLQVR